MTDIYIIHKFENGAKELFCSEGLDVMEQGALCLEAAGLDRLLGSQGLLNHILTQFQQRPEQATTSFYTQTQRSGV